MYCEKEVGRLLREISRGVSPWLFVVETFLRAPRDEVIRDALLAHRTFTDASVFLRAPCFKR